MKKQLAIVFGLMLGASLAFAPTAFSAEDGAPDDASSECSDGDGDLVAGTLSAEGGAETGGETAVCINETDGTVDGATRVGGSPGSGGYVIADGDGDNRPETQGYIGVEVDSTTGPQVVSDGDNCNYNGSGEPTDPEGVVAFVSGEPGDGVC